MNRLQKEYAPRGLDIIAITQERPEDVVPFLEKNGVEYPVYQDGGGRLFREFEVRGIPVAVLVDEEDMVIWSGSPSSSTLHELIEKHLSSG